MNFLQGAKNATLLYFSKIDLSLSLSIPNSYQMSGIFSSIPYSWVLGRSLELLVRDKHYKTKIHGLSLSSPQVPALLNSKGAHFSPQYL